MVLADESLFPKPSPSSADAIDSKIRHDNVSETNNYHVSSNSNDGAHDDYVSSTCNLSFSFGGDDDNGDGNGNTSGNTHKTDVKKSTIYLKNVHDLLSASKSSHDDKNAEIQSQTGSCYSYDNVEIIEMAGRPIVLKDCVTNNSAQFTTITATTRISTNDGEREEEEKKEDNQTSIKHTIHDSRRESTTFSTGTMSQSINNLPPTKESLQQSTSSSATTIGSAKRIAVLDERKHSIVHSGMWKAHRSGLALTPGKRHNPSPSITLHPTTSFRRRVFASQRHRSTVSASRNLSSMSNQFDSSSMSTSIPPIQLANRLRSSSSIRTPSGEALTRSFLRRSSTTTTPGAADVSLMSSIPSIRLGNPLRSSSSFRSLSGDTRSSIRLVSTTTAAAEAASSYAFKRRNSFLESFPSLNYANPLDESLSGIDSLSSTQHATRQSFIRRRTSDLSESEMDLGMFHESVDSLDLATSEHSYWLKMQKGLNVSNSIVEEPLRSSSSIPSLDLAHYICKASNLSPSIFVSPSSDDVNDSTMKSSVPPLQPGRVRRQSSTNSVHSLRFARPIQRVASDISTASSVGLNALKQSYPFDNDSSAYPKLTQSYLFQRYGSNTSFESSSSASLRFASPIRTIRFPSPDPFNRSMSFRQRRTASFSSAPKVYSPIKEEHSRRGSASTNESSKVFRDIDTLETIPSQDVKHFNDDNDTIYQCDESERDDVGEPKPAWLSPLHESLEQVSTSNNTKPVMIRKASIGFDDGLGLEVAEVNNASTAEAMLRLENIDAYRTVKSLMSFSSSNISMDDSFLNMSSAKNLWTKPGLAFDDSDLRSCMSDEETCYLMDRSLHKAGNLHCLEDDRSWDPCIDDVVERKFNAWNVLVDDYEQFGYGRRGLPFQIFGTSADDVDSQPHVLSPPLMESIYEFLPFAFSEQSFWMKYSLVRDGASFFKLLQNVRGSKATVLAIETTDGEVFGSFTSTPWRKNTTYFGSGEAFLWRMRHDRKTTCKSIIDQARLESEIEVYPWTGMNHDVQLCKDSFIALGSGSSSEEGKSDMGFGLCIDRDMLHGTSSYSTTFGNPPLSYANESAPFEIVNMEVWTLTPAFDVEEAEKLEFGRLFLELHGRDNN